jgi:hypothetical protein
MYLLLKDSVPVNVASVPVVGKVTEVLAVEVKVVVKAPDVVKLPPIVMVLPVFATPVPPYCPPMTLPFHVVFVDNVLLVNVSDPASVDKVPAVGNVTLVPAVAIKVVSKAPDVVKFPPIVMVLPVFATPVPPYCPAIILPFQVVLVDSVLLVKDSIPANVARVPAVGNVTDVAPVAVKVWAKAPA